MDLDFETNKMMTTKTLAKENKLNIDQFKQDIE